MLGINWREVALITLAIALWVGLVIGLYQVPQPYKDILQLFGMWPPLSWWRFWSSAGSFAAAAIAVASEIRVQTPPAPDSALGGAQRRHHTGRTVPGFVNKKSRPRWAASICRPLSCPGLSRASTS